MTQGNINVNLEVYLNQDCVSSCIISSYHNINTIGVDVTCDVQTDTELLLRVSVAIRKEIVFFQYSKNNLKQNFAHSVPL